MELLSLPVTRIESILSFFSYDEIAKLRLVCRDFDSICQRLLNRGFMLIERRIAKSLKTVKMKLPRRESERRYHPFSKHYDILTSVETRISMLTMTYTKFIDHGICCFIPGKVIDEIEKVLLIVESSPVLPRAHEVLQELRDISSMAIEHFDDKISPALRKKLHDETPVIANPNSNLGAGPPAGYFNELVASDTPTDVHTGLQTEFMAIKQSCMINRHSTRLLAMQCTKLNKKLRTYRRVIATQGRQLKEVNLWKADHDKNMAELKRRIEECDMIYSELKHQPVAKAPAGAESNEELSQSRNQTLRNFSSQIKLDLSVLPIGSDKIKAQAGSNIRPRATLSLSPPTDRLEDVPIPGASGSPDSHGNAAADRLERQSLPTKRPAIESILNEFNKRQRTSVDKTEESLRKVKALLFDLFEE